MYNGIGLQTARGSGTNGYIQSNKFFVKARVSKVLTDPSSIKGFESGQGTAGVTRKPNKEILEHDRKRQIELKLLVLEEKLTDQGYTDSEIAEKLQEVRFDLESQAAADEDGGAGAIVSSDKKVSDTQTHQVAARKEKQMETLRAALGIGVETENQKKLPDVPLSDSEDVSNDDKPSKNRKKDGPSLKKHGTYVLEEKDDKRKGVKDKRIESISKKLDESKRHKKGSRKGRCEESSKTDTSSSETDDDGKAVKASKKKHRRSAHSSESDDESDAGGRKRRQQYSARKKKSRRHDIDYSDSESDTESDSDSSSDSEPDRKYGKSLKRQDSDDDSRSDEDFKYKSKKAKVISRRGRYDSEDESSSDVEKKDKINHSERWMYDHRSGFRSGKDGTTRDDHRVSKGRRDNADERYGLRSDSESDKVHKGKNNIDMSRRHDSDEDESSSDREKKYSKNYSEKRNEQQSAARLEKEDIVHDTHTVSKGRRPEISRRYDRKSDSESDEARRRKNRVEDSRRHDDQKSDSESDGAPRRKNRVENSRRGHDDRKSNSESDEALRRKNRVQDSRTRHDDRKSDSESDEAPRRKNRVEDSRRRYDSDEDESDYDKKEKIQKSRRRDRDTSSESDASERSDHRLERNDRAFKSLEKNNNRRPDDMVYKGRKAGGKAYEREDDENIKHKRASQKVDDRSDTLSKLEKLYQSREEKIDGAGYGRSKRKMDDGYRDEQPEGKSRRHDLGSETEFAGAKSKPDSERSPGRWGTTQSRVEVHNERGRPGQDAREHQGRKHGRDDEEDVYRKHGRDRDHQRERHWREEEDHLSLNKRDRDLDSSKRARYDDSGSSRRRFDDGRHDDRRRSRR